VLNINGTLTYYTVPVYQREPWRQLILNLHEQYSPEETLVVFAFPAPFAPWTLYEKNYERPFATLSSGSYDLGDGIIPNRMMTMTNYPRVIVFDYLRSLTDRYNIIPKTLEQTGYSEVAIYDYNTLGFVRVWEWGETSKL
jgi:hypothetical protein